MKNYWLLFTLHRFNFKSRSSTSLISSLFPILGIGFGVTVLIVVLAVMNGFQRGYIDTVIEVTSAHLRLSGNMQDLQDLQKKGEYKSFVIFNEEQSLLQGYGSRQSSAMIRMIENDIMEKDAGFKAHLEIVQGIFNVADKSETLLPTIVLGEELARRLAVGVSDTIKVIATSGNAETDLFPEGLQLFVIGLFKTGYYEFDSTLAFVSIDEGEHLFGKMQNYLANVKFEKDDGDVLYIAKNIKDDRIKAETWREYNKSFFGALKIEKNVMMLLVILIFLVVGVNIYNGMRRSIYERREDISILLSMGARMKSLASIFIINGFVIGFLGSLVGLLFGLAISININSIFDLIEKCVNLFTYLLSVFLGGSSSGDFEIFSSTYFYMEKVPVKIFFEELFFISLFAVFASSFAAWVATKKVMEIKVAEILRYE